MTKLKKVSDSLSYENVIGKGSYGIVYRGYFNNKEVAIKKIDLDTLDEKDMEVERHCELNHENVVKILTVEKDEFFKFIVLELCAGSLEQVIDNEYNGPTLPPDVMVFNQIANGLDYIHSKRLIHRDIKPANILISIEIAPTLKLADFGLSKRLTTQHSCSMSGLKGTKSWMAPEILRNTKRISFKCDIFSAGLVFTVFLTHGIHPFGNDYFEQQENIITNNPVNLNRLESEHFAAGIISEMIKDNLVERPSSAKLKQDLETMIQYNQNNSSRPNNILNISSYLSIQFEDLTINHDVNLSHILGESSAATVFLGHINQFPVAVKRVLQTEQHSIRTSKDDQAIHSLKHENIVKILRMYEKDNFRYTVMELCAGTLDEAIKNSYKGPNLPSDRQVLHGIVNGLEYIHSQHFVHANLKPKNILISMAGQVKLSNWNLNPLQTTHKVQKYLEGTLIWEAPEMLKAINESQDNFTPISDVFSFGCICFYFLTRGIHPFGDVKEVQNNIQTNNPVNINKQKSDNFPVPVINKLIEHDRQNRMQLAEFKEWLIKSFNKTSESITTEVNHKENSLMKNAVIENKLGRGRYGTVSKGRYTNANGKTVVAAFKSNPTGDDTFLTREIEILKQLNHLFVVEYLGVVEENSRKWIVMELCEGSLKAYVKGELERVPKNTLDDKILIGQITLGMTYIHNHGIIHKDLKPDNILLWCHPTQQELVLVKIADFGFAKELKPEQAEFSNTKHPGTEGYMAPELLNAADGNYPASFASDVFALGITIGWIALKGTHPITTSGKEVRNLLVMKGMIPQHLQTLSWDLQHLILKLTDKDPKRRPNINLVLLHPYFVLTNDKTKWQFIKTLFDLLEVKKQSKAVHEILNCQNFQNWYNTLSAYGTLTEEDASKKRDLKILSEMLSSNEILYDIESYEHVIIETVKVEYDINVGSQIDRILYNQTSYDNASLPYRLYKLIQSAPKLVSLYIWTQLVKIFVEEVQQHTNVEDSSKMETQSTIHSSSRPSIKINLLMKPEKLGNQLTIPISDLVWTSLFYDKRELVDELWMIKYGSEQFKKDQEMDQETLNGMLVSLVQCDFTEQIWRVLLTKMEDVSPLLFASVQSHSAAKMTEMILKEKGWPSWMMENKEMLLTPMHIAAYNQGKFGAEIMKILLDNGGNPKIIGPHCVTPLHYAVGNESDSALGIVQLLLKYGANPNVRDDQGFMPIHYAA